MLEKKKGAESKQFELADSIDKLLIEVQEYHNKFAIRLNELGTQVNDYQKEYGIKRNQLTICFEIAKANLTKLKDQLLLASDDMRKDHEHHKLRSKL